MPPMPRCRQWFHHDSHDQLPTHLADVLAADNFARRLKTLNGLIE
jgi:hypothetical protein